MKQAKDYNWSDKCILIAEDSEPSVLYFRAALKNTKARLLFAQNGLEAIRLFRKNPHIDLVLMDLDMPILNGLDAAKQIRKHKAEAIIIAQTAHVYPGDFKDSQDAGCDEFMPKPIPLELLYTTIERYLKSGER